MISNDVTQVRICMFSLLSSSIGYVCMYVYKEVRKRGIVYGSSKKSSSAEKVLKKEARIVAHMVVKRKLAVQGKDARSLNRGWGTEKGLAIKNTSACKCHQET